MTHHHHHIIIIAAAIFCIITIINTNNFEIIAGKYRFPVQSSQCLISLSAMAQITGQFHSLAIVVTILDKRVSARTGWPSVSTV